MRFALKICLCTVLIVAVLFGVAGQILIGQSFNANLDFQVDKAQSQFAALCSALDAEIYGMELYYETATPRMFQEVLSRAAGSLGDEAICALYDSQRTLLAATDEGFDPLLQGIAPEKGEFMYCLLDTDEGFILESAGMLIIENTAYYLYTHLSARTLTDLYDREVRAFVLLHSLTVAICIAAMLILSYFNTRSIRTLNRATHRIAAGQYQQRAEVESLDEIGDLALSFNAMAGAIQQKVGDLEGYAKQQKDFVASFSHELKTPMTSIIGYADMLRSHEMDPEDAFMAANFIYSEGKRLEAMSLKLMDLVVLDKNDFTLVRGYSRRIMGHVVAVVTPMLEKNGLTLSTGIEQQLILYEKDLLLTMLTNLIDNARKASEPGKIIFLSGKKQQNRYRITVRDQGIGIPEEDLKRITEAFFMVDKSRARAQHGAGLGLAISNRIAQLHGSELHFESKLGVGTTVWLDLPLYDGTRRKKEAPEA